MSGSLRAHMHRGSEPKPSLVTSSRFPPPSPPGAADGSNRGRFTSIQQVRSTVVGLSVHRHVVKEDWLQIQI